MADHSRVTMNMMSTDDHYLNQLFHHLADAIFISECLTDGYPGRYLNCNNAMHALLGYSAAELSALGPMDINRIAHEDPANYAKVINELHRTGKALYRTDLRHKDGHWVHVEISCQLNKLNEQKVFFCLARDISVREKYEESIKALVRSTVGLTGVECLEEMSKNLCNWLNVEGSCIGVFKDEQLHIKAGYYQGLKLPPAKLSAQSLPMKKVKRGELSFYPNDAHLYFEGQENQFLRNISCFLACPMFGHDGQVLGMVCVFSRDSLKKVSYLEDFLSIIASRAASECERLHYVRELSHNEEMLRTLFNSTAEAIVGIDLNGDIVFCNPSTLKMLGHGKEEELIGKNLYKMIKPATTANGCDSNSCPFIQVISAGEKITSEDTFRRCDGSVIPVEYWGHPMYRDKQLIGGVITFIDISRRKKLEEQLQHSQKMEAIGTLTGGIAHDFNNILTVISGYVGLLKDQFAHDEKLLRKIGKIGAAAERGSKLTHGLLAYSRKKTEPSTPVDLNQLVIKVHDIFGQIIGENIKQSLTLYPKQLTVRADSSQLEQVLVNLATNARDAMPHGGQLQMKIDEIDIDQAFCRTYGYGEPGHYAQITVEDSGIGIPKSLQQKIFDPFFTTKDTGKGTGLGLAMVWGIVKQHKGYVLVESAPDQGSRFRIILPICHDKIAQPGPVRDGRASGGDETLLLVEDDPLVREATEQILISAGYHVLTCDCAEEALRLFHEGKHHQIALILSDVVMPGMKGPDFYLELRTLTSIPVIFMTGYTFDSLREQGLLREGVPVLYKPIQPFDLLSRIRQLLDK